METVQIVPVLYIFIKPSPGKTRNKSIWLIA